MRKSKAGKAFVWTTVGLLLGTATSLIILAWAKSGNTPFELTAEVLVYLALAMAVSMAIAATTFSITTRSVCRNVASAIDKVVCGDFSSDNDRLPDGYTTLTDELGRLSVMLENSSRHGAEKDDEARELKERAQTLEEMLIHANSDLSHKEVLLKEINRELALANHAKTEFISGMGRELRLPLNTIVGLTDFIYHGNLGPVSDKQKEYLKKIRTRADNMLYIVSHVLEYTRLDAGEQIKCEELDLSVLAGEVAESISGFAAEKKVTVELDVAKTTIEADPIKLRFIL
ncbi:MAG TPA: HAMP domain-containing sensor histidine kinase, partial [Nitrospirota bacterium]